MASERPRKLGGHAGAWENVCKELKQREGMPGPPHLQVPSAHSEVVRAAGAPAPREQLVPVAFLGSQACLVGVEHLIWAEPALVFSF